MVQLQWPTIRRHTSQNALKHLASLEADFQALDACVKLNVSRQNELPSSFQKDISRAIFQALTDHEYPYEISEADRTLIGGLLLKHITVEAVERARDRIPLRQYRGLHKSFRTLATKFKAKGNQPHLKETTEKDERRAKSLIESSPEFETIYARRASLSRQAEVVRPAAPSNSDDTHEGARQAHSSRGRGRDATKAASAIDPTEKKGRKRKKRDEDTHAKTEYKASVMRDDGGILETMGNQYGAQEVDLHEAFIDSGVETNDHEDLIRMFKDTEAQCEHISLQLQDLESGQVEGSTTTHVADELMEDQDVRTFYPAEEDDAGVGLLEGGNLVNHPSDATQGPSGQADNQKRFERNELFLQDWEVKEELEDPDASSLITFNIEHQAAVNQLDDMDSDSILRKLSSSLETMRSLGHHVPHFIRFTNARLLDNGNLEVHVHAESKDDIERLSRIRGWDFEFEKCISTPIRTYAVETSRIRVDIFDMQTRKNKTAVIRELLEENLRFIVSMRGIDDIQDIRWRKGSKMGSSLVIEFRTARQANEVLDSGLFVRGKHHKCQSVDYQTRARCGRCQVFGHHETTCSSTHRCGKCALQHPTPTCTSDIRLCANCRGPHEAKAPTCPARKAHKQRLRHTDHSSPVTKQENEEPGPEPQSRTAALNSSSLNPMPIIPHIEGEIKVEGDESFQNIGPVRQSQGNAAAPRHTAIPTHLQHGPYVEAEGIGITQEMGLAQNQHPDFMMMQRQLEDLRKIVVERLAVPQHPHSERRKRGADENVMGGPSSYPRKRSWHTTQRPAYYPSQPRNNLPADSSISPYAVPFPRTTYATSTLYS